MLFVVDIKCKYVPMNSKTTILTFLCIALTFFCGCASFESLSQKRFTVESSSLDWVQFSRTIQGDDKVEPKTIRLQLDGSGYLEYKSGKSSRVKNDFWQESEADNWQDLQTDHIVLSQEETVKYYQRLVDAGIYDRVKQTKEEKAVASLAILARIDFEKKLTLTSDPVLIKIFDELLAKF